MNEIESIRGTIRPCGIPVHPVYILFANGMSEMIKLPNHCTQVEILPLPTLQRLLSAQLPNTKLKLLRIPFHATWRQSLADFQ